MTLRQTNKKHLEIFEVLRFPLIIGIVFIHSYHPAMETITPTALFTWHFIKDGIASVAVPAFFFISGYLFFYKPVSWRGKLKSRVFTILIPYVFWTVFYWTLMFTAGHLPEPTLPQFWYLSELALLCLVAPVLHYLHKRAYLFLAVFAAVYLFADFHLTNYVLTSMMPVLFFYAGSVLAVKGLSPQGYCGSCKQEVYSRSFTGLAFMYLTLGVLNGNELLHKLGVISGVIGVLWLASKVKGKFKALMLGLSGASFFVFAFHEPLIKFLFTDMYMRYKPQGDAVLILYFVSAIVMLYASVSVYKTLRWFAPGFTNFITGGRS